MRIQSKYKNIAERLFFIGILLTIALLPFDRWAGHIGPLSLPLLSFIFLIPHPLIRLFERPRRLLLCLPLLLILCAAILSLINAISVQVSANATVLLGILIIKACFIILGVLPRHLPKIENVFLGISSIAIVFGYYQFIGDLMNLPPSLTGLLPQYSSTGTYIFPRIQSFAQEPLYLANFLLLPISILLAQLVRFGRLPIRLYLLLVLAVIAIFLTGSRGGLIGLTAVVAGVLIILVRKSSRFTKLAFPVAIALLSVALSIGVLAYNYSQSHGIEDVAGIPRTYSQSLTHIFNFNDRSANTRYEVWPLAVDAFTSSPYTGVGLYGSRLFLHKDDFTRGVPVGNLQPLNNDYLALFSELGGIGVLLLLPFILILTRLVWRAISKPGISTPYALMLIGMAIQAATFQSILLLRVWVVVALLVATAEMESDVRHKPKAGQTKLDGRGFKQHVNNKRSILITSN